jgi:hypothetical protein
MQNGSGVYPYGGAPRNAMYLGHHQGATALALLALIHAGTAVDDEAIERGVEWILRAGKTAGASTHHRYVYATGLVIWLLATVDEELYRPEIRELASRLAHGAASSGYWGYYNGGLRGNVRDLPNISTTQYAVLGLREASRVGVKVPDRTWKKLERTLRNRQRSDGGWAYTPSGGKSTFTSTAIGVASLVIARAELAREGDDLASIVATPEVRRGLAAMADRFGEVLRPRWTALDYYGLYAAERAGVVAGVRRLGERDWYAEGAKKLLEAQREDGSWFSPGDSRHPPAVSTSFALLFLTRATRPVVPVATGGEKRVEASGGGIRVDGAGKLSDKDFRDLVDALLGELAGGGSPGATLEKIESLSPRIQRFLVDRLESETLAVRRAAITALHAMSGTRRSYEPDGPEAERKAAVARWRKALE